jgi:hypothetical protein
MLLAKLMFQNSSSSGLDPLVGSSRQPLRWAIDQSVEYFCRGYSHNKAHGKASHVCTCDGPVLCFCEVKPQFDAGGICNDALQQEPAYFQLAIDRLFEKRGTTYSRSVFLGTSGVDCGG